MAAQICIKMARGTSFQLVNIANRVASTFFCKLGTPIKSILPREPYFSTSLISLSEPHPKVIQIISNNNKNDVNHNKFEKHKLESKIKLNLRKRVQTGAKMFYQ